MNTNNPTDLEKLLYKLIIQFAVYTLGTDKQLDPHLLGISQSFKQGLSYQDLTPELLALSKTLNHISLPENRVKNKETPSSKLQLQKEFIARLISLLAETNIPLNLKNQYALIKQKSRAKLNEEDSNKLIDLTLSLIIAIKDSAIIEQQNIENFLKDILKRFNQFEEHTLSFSSSNKQSVTDREKLNKAINLQIESIKACSSNAKDLPSLQGNIQQHLQELDFQLIKHQKIETDRHHITDERLEQMSQKIHEMEVEANSLRSNLEHVSDKALRDSLTGLPNREAYNERAIIEFNRWFRYKDDLSFVIWDIDFFKHVNDNFGHKAGDKTLSLVSRLILQHCRKSDFIARFGGEEFIMILPHTNSEQALIAAEKIRNLVADSGFNHSGQSIKLTISCGISEFSDGDEIEHVFERADQALYQSKENGRNCSTILNK
ncbi:MAG: GGDEF domain-containing protein [Methylococcales bacterium]|nr:GGDEF domain-containing protein [Methylococcales bacterium]